MAAQTPRLRNRPAQATKATKPAVIKPDAKTRADQAEKPDPDAKKLDPIRKAKPEDTEHPIAMDKQLETAQEERARDFSTEMRTDGTTPRHREPLGPPAPGQDGRRGPERRVDSPAGMPSEDKSDPANTPESRGPRFKVKATRMGYYDHARRRAGDVFYVDRQGYSERWMETVDGTTPLKLTTAKAALQADHDQKRADRNLGKDSTGSRNVLDDDDDR